MRILHGVSLCLLFDTPSDAQAVTPAVERAFERFWKAGNPSGALKAVPAILEAGVDFEAARARLSADRPLPVRPQTGELSLSSLLSDGRTRPYTVAIPDDILDGEELPVRFQLHGGVNRPASEEGAVQRPRRRSLEGMRHIVVQPTGDAGATWWSQAQVENLAFVLDRLKRSLRIDNNRVYLTGVSDGGTGAYYMAARDTTPWSCFLPLNGSLRVLANPGVGSEGALFVRNLANKPFYIVNGALDPLYPVTAILPMIDLYRRAGVALVFRPQQDAGHDTRWWPKVSPEFEAFVRDHPRNPLPDRILWQTERADRGNRAHWLVIDAVGSAAGDATFDDFNSVPGGLPRDFGIRVDAAQPAIPRLAQVVKGSDADRLGLQKDDLALEIGGAPVSSTDDLFQGLGRYVMGTPLRMVVERKGRRQSLEVTIAANGPEAVFALPKTSGRVELQKNDNAVEAKRRGVRRFTLLLSPDHFDVAQPVRVSVNGRIAFEGSVTKDLKTLLTWAARDNDRTMLFGAELKISLPRAPTNVGTRGGLPAPRPRASRSSRDPRSSRRRARESARRRSASAAAA